MAYWVLATERAYVTAALAKSPAPPLGPTMLLGRARAAAGAVASRYLAVGTPRSLALIVDGGSSVEDAALSVHAHRTWFAPTDVRCAGEGAEQLAEQFPGARVTTTPEALACDIVCIHAPMTLAPEQLRRGTHVNVLATVAISDDLAQLATVTHELPGLGELAAGLVDGRQLDELTVFVIGDAAIALAAVALPA